MVKTLPANVGDMGSIPGVWKIPHAAGNEDRGPELLSLCSRAQEPQLLSPRAAATEAHVP